jgi:hypothetical protein
VKRIEGSCESGEVDGDGCLETLERRSASKIWMLVQLH